MVLVYVGIDPGLSGGIALITEDKVKTFVMPTVTKGKKRALDHFSLAAFFTTFEPVRTFVIIEEQHAMPKQGVVSMMTIGCGFCALKQCLVDYSIPHEIVRAKEWQKEYNITGSKGNTKAQALQVCNSLFPNANLLATERSKKPHDGIVDAVLIAEFARRKQWGATR